MNRLSLVTFRDVRAHACAPVYIYIYLYMIIPAKAYEGHAMAMRTYIPSLLSIARRLNRYIERYDLTIADNLTEPRKAAFLSFKAALETFIAANDGFVS